ncbi:P27 family phage terminase small subunit [Lacipirellula sp.]|uniref:P27 family phage terminase small subunit n=1 Tax=Lacipirellula sp. TaxID=2691419 RepID=UPI003D111CD7
MGRHPKTEEQLAASGGYRADRHAGRKNSPKFDGVPTPPAGLSFAARKHWDVVVPALIEGGLAKAIDAPALAAMCEAWSEYCEAIAMRVDPEFIDVRRKRQMLISSALRAWRDLAARFGMTPSDRARLEVAPDGKEENPFLALWQQPAQTKTQAKGKGNGPTKK